MACIAIDCRFASGLSGLGTYTRSVVPRLISCLEGHHVIVFVQDSSEEWLSTLPKRVERIETPYPHYSFAEQIQLPRRLKQLSVDLFYSPHFNVPLWMPCPFVATIHDLILHRYPNRSGLFKQLAYRIVMRHTIGVAKHLIAVSVFTQKEISDIYGVKTLTKTSVVTEGFDPIFTPNGGSHDQHILYVGNAKEHKNLQMLLDAYEQLDDPVELLLVTGGREWKKLRIPDGVRVRVNAPHEAVPDLYRNATCFVTPSLYEGFCLPLLEARACGCPVIAVRGSATDEVVGNTGMLVDPTPHALTHALTHPPITSTPPESQYNWDSVSRDISGILIDTLNG